MLLTSDPASVVEAGTAALLGVVAGLAVAVPVGPVAVLVVREGMARGTRTGLAAGAGVATVDAGYAVLAVVAGVQVSRALAQHEAAVRTGGALVLAVVGLVGLARWWTTRSSSHLAPGRPGAPGADGRGATAGATWARFTALTLLNPLTALVFASVAAGLGGRLAPGVVTSAAFVLGAAVASLTWQSVLALASAWLGGRVGSRWHGLTAPLGSVLVVLLAASVALG
ncbi:LysE family translocator [Cellulomonas sp. DKR-3]|uniref:LysE family translocator n=1 Tax=Cellulomonas fulva TaxID=2835530 RepID=A0ABS5TXQ2_9CELL|nr:LysE family transporter [Cellulomonas fulva]MBT0993925.1 LysE family translocator [Cellulomonas fulva]